MSIVLGDAFVRVRPDTKTFGAELGSGISSSTSNVGSKFGTFAKRVGIGMAAAGAYGAVQFMKGAVKLEAEFGKTMNVLAATTNTPRKGMQELSALAMKMGAETVFSANDASKAMLELARGGLSAAAIQGGALQGTLTLAAAGELSMSEAANIAVKSMGQFNLRGKDMGSIAAALAGAANASSASVRDMSQALAQGGLAAKSVGFSIQETTGILAAFSNNGLEGSDAGTSLKTALDRLIPASKEATGAMQSLGIITADGRNQFLKANGEYRSAAEVAGVLQRATEGLSASERKRAISTIFGSDAQRAATILAKEGEAGIRKMTRATSDQNAAQRAARANMKGTAGALEQMHGSLETAQLAWGKAQKPLIKFGALVITKIANGAVPIIEDLGRVMRTGLGDVNLDGITRGLAKVDVASIFGKIRDSIASVDWKAIGAGFRDIGGATKEMGPGLREASEGLPTLTDGLKVGERVMKFFADHAGLVAKAMPLLAIGFVAVKAAQVAANTAALISVPVRIAEVFAIRAQTAALRGHSVAMAGSTLATQTSTKATLLSRVASLAAAAATKVMAGATRVLNVVMRMNPIGLVVTALGLLVVGLIVAYKKSETFRAIVDGALRVVGKAAKWLWDSAFKPAFAGIKLAISAVGEAGKWLWNKALAPAFRFIVRGVAGILEIWARMLRALGNVPHFGWAKDAAAAMQGAADKANNFAAGIKNIPDSKNVRVNISITRTIRNIAQSIQGSAQSAVDQVTGGHRPRSLAPRVQGAQGRAALGGVAAARTAPLIWIENLIAHDEAAAMYAARVEAQKALALMGSP